MNRKLSFNVVKKLSALLLFSMFALGLQAQTSVIFTFANGQGSPSQFVGASESLQAAALNNDGTVTVTGEPAYQTLDTNGSTVFANLQGGNPLPIAYAWTVPANSGTNGPSQTYSGYILVTTTNLGTIASSLIQVFPAPTPTGFGWAWSAQTSDLRYAMATGTNSYTNFVTPGILLSASNALAVQIVGATNGQTLIVYSNPAAFLTPQQGTNLVFALAQTNAPTSLLTITNIAFQQATNQGVANTNFSLVISNFVSTNSLAQLIATNAALTITVSNQNVSLLAAMNTASNLLAQSKQGTNGYLSNLGVTGANTNIYLAGQNMTVTTNAGGNIQTWNATNQTSLTNGLAVWSTVVPTSFLQTNALPGLTNGFVTAVVTNGLATISYVDAQVSGGANTNQYAPGQNVTFTTNFNGSIISINGTSQTNLTNGLAVWSSQVPSSFLLTNQLPGLTNGFVGANVTNGLLTTSAAALLYYPTSNPSQFVSASVTNGLATTNYAYPASNPSGYISSAGTNGLATTNFVVAYADTNGAGRAAAAALPYQPTNNNLTLISGTGANTNIYLPTTGVYFVTNMNGSIQSIGASNQTFLTNHMLDAYAPTNTLNGWYDTNGAALAAYTNAVNVSTNYANTNVAAQVAAAFAFASTNPNSLFVAATNGNATALTVQTSLTLGADTNWIVGTNWIKVLGGGCPYAHGEYQQIVNGVWTNVTAAQNGFPGYSIVFVGGVYSLLSNNFTLYLTNSVNGFWMQGPSGTLPVPYVAFTAPYDAVLAGDVVATNLAAQWNASISGMSNNVAASNFVAAIASQYGGGGGSGTTNFLLGANSASVVNGPTTNNGFSAAGSNFILSVVETYASNPTNGISATTATNIVVNVSQNLGIMGATNINVLGVGPNGGLISFPNGDSIYEQSPGNSPRPNDSGLSLGLGNGQIYGEQFSYIAGASNDVQGSAINELIGNSISGGVSNKVGNGSGSVNNYNAILGGFQNIMPASDSFSTIAGGQGNNIQGSGSFAAGRKTTITGAGDFVFSDGEVVTSTIAGQAVFTITNGMAINTNSAGTNGLEVNGNIDSTFGFSVNGVPISGGSGSATNAIANNNGFGTNTTLIGTNNISGITIYNSVNINTNEIFVSVSNLGLYPGSQGNYQWLPSAPGGASYYFVATNGQPYRVVLSGGVYYWAEGVSVVSGSFFNQCSNLVLISTYVSIYGDGDTVTVSYPASHISTNSYIAMNGTGANGSEIEFPDGDAIYEQSFSNIKLPGDSGLSLGLNNGQIWGESYSFVSGSYNDVAGGSYNPIIGGTILGGTNNIVGNRLGGSWSTTVGGRNNYVTGTNSMALGSANTIATPGTLMWNDYAGGPKTSTIPNSVVFNTGGGMGINTNNPGTNGLEVNGNIDSTVGFSVNGVPISGGGGGAAFNPTNNFYFFTNSATGEWGYWDTNGIGFKTNVLSGAWQINGNTNLHGGVGLNTNYSIRNDGNQSWITNLAMLNSIQIQSLDLSSPTNTYQVLGCPDTTFNGVYSGGYITNGVGFLTNSSGRWLCEYGAAGANGSQLQSNNVFNGVAWYDTAFGNNQLLPNNLWERSSDDVIKTAMVCYGLPFGIGNQIQLTASSAWATNLTSSSVTINVSTNGTITYENDGVGDVRENVNLQAILNGAPVGNILNTAIEYEGTTSSGLEYKVSTNSGYSDFWSIYYFINPPSVQGVRGQYLHSPVFSANGQMLGYPENRLGYDNVDSVFQNPPAWVNIYGQATNRAAFWLDVGSLATNAQVGSFQFSTNRYWGTTTNSVGVINTSPFVLVSDLTNNINGSGLTNLNASQLTSGTVPSAVLSGNSISNAPGFFFPAGGGSTANAAVTNNPNPQIWSGQQNLTNTANVLAGNGIGITNLSTTNLVGSISATVISPVTGSGALVLSNGPTINGGTFIGSSTFSSVSATSLTVTMPITNGPPLAGSNSLTTTGWNLNTNGNANFGGLVSANGFSGTMISSWYTITAAASNTNINWLATNGCFYLYNMTNSAALTNISPQGGAVYAILMLTNNGASGTNFYLDCACTFTPPNNIGSTTNPIFVPQGGMAEIDVKFGPGATAVFTNIVDAP